MLGDHASINGIKANNAVLCESDLTMLCFEQDKNEAFLQDQNVASGLNSIGGTRQRLFALNSLQKYTLRIQQTLDVQY